MNFVDGLNFVDGKTLRQIPCQPGRGAPTKLTAGAVGCLYMDTDSDKLYLCNGGTPGAYSWIPAGDVEALGAQVEALAQDVADLKYIAIDITSISNSVGTVEMGTVVRTVTITWALNKAPVSQTVDGAAVDPAARSVTLAGLSVTSAKSYTVKATDERGASDTASTGINFYNGVYYGVVANTAALTSATIRGLTRKLQSGKALTFTVNAGASQRIAYALPTRYGTPGFNVGGFDGGFYLAATIDFVNASGYTEPYNVWLSDNPGLGDTTVKVT